MKNRVKISYCILICIILYLSNQQTTAAAQNKVNMSAGFGVPELVNLGIRYQLHQAQLAFSIDSTPYGLDEKLLSLSADAYVHIGGVSK